MFINWQLAKLAGGMFASLNYCINDFHVPILICSEVNSAAKSASTRTTLSLFL